MLFQMLGPMIREPKISLVPAPYATINGLW
jgi:hypothetical protein